MAIQIEQTKSQAKPSFVACIYGMGGVGKTSLATTAPKPIFLDAEEGTKALGARGIDVPVIKVKTWADVIEARNLVIESPAYETIVIDPTGHFLDLLIEAVKGNGSMDLGKWGQAKEKFRKFMWVVKMSGKHVLFIAHDNKKPDEQKMLREPEVAANLSLPLVNLCDVVGYMQSDEQGKRSIRFQPTEKIVAKDRFDSLGSVTEELNVANWIAKIHAKYPSNV